MDRLFAFLTRRRGQRRFDLVDILTYAYLLLGTVIMFGPVLWLVLSSFKTSAQLTEFPPRFLPYRQETATVAGYPQTLPLFKVVMSDGSVKKLAEVSRIGIEAQ